MSETRERILRAVREVFSELGYDAATFQAIAIRADLTRPAINHYVPGKRVLYREVVDQTNTTLMSACLDKSRDETTLRGRMSALIGAAIQLDSKRSLARGIPGVLGAGGAAAPGVVR